MEPTHPAPNPGVRRSMQSNRSRDTKPELKVRRLVHAAGLRYRVNARPIAKLPRTADLLFTRARVAVLIDGCFWHGCAQHYRAPKTNQAYWMNKLARNVARDAETVRVLEESGWIVLRFWEHSAPDAVANAIKHAVAHSLRANRASRPAACQDLEVAEDRSPAEGGA